MSSASGAAALRLLLVLLFASVLVRTSVVRVSVRTVPLAPDSAPVAPAPAAVTPGTTTSVRAGGSAAKQSPETAREAAATRIDRFIREAPFEIGRSRWCVSAATCG